jgi:hypothetical protein
MIQRPKDLQDDFTCGMMPCPRLLELGIHAVGYMLAGIYGTLGLWARGKGEQRHRQRRIQLDQRWRQDHTFRFMGVCEGHILRFFEMGRRTTPGCGMGLFLRNLEDTCTSEYGNTLYLRINTACPACCQEPWLVVLLDYEFLPQCRSCNAFSP